MANRYVPFDTSKVMVIRDVTPNIVTCSSPFLRFGRLKIGGRGTIVKLQSGAIAVFSPTALTPEVRSKVTSLGDEVKYIAALDYEHHIFLSEWAKAYPSAAVMGVEGLPEKREKDPATAGLKFKYLWTEENRKEMTVDPDFDKEFDYEYVSAHANKELVFYHKPERTLIQADLMFNLPAYEQFSKTGQDPTSGILTKIFNSIQNTKGAAMGQRRFIWYACSANKPSFNESIRKIDKWDFNRIIPCHGDVIENDGKGIFQKIFEWHLKAQQ